MFTVSIENEKGESIQLHPSDKYTVTEITGLNPPTSNINTSTNANFDGSVFKSSRLNERNIVITFAIEGNAEDNRNELYKYAVCKKSCKFIFANGIRKVYIKGYVESFDVSSFDVKETAQISIICPNPYFVNQDDTMVEFTSIIPLFEFPFSIASEGIEFSRLVLGENKDIYNSGNVETGMIIEFKALGETTNPTIYNFETGAKIKVNVTLEEGDILTVNTNKGQKSVTKNHNGVITNAINLLDRTSEWLQLISGDNIFLYTADTLPQNLTCTIYYNELFEGV